MNITCNSCHTTHDEAAWSRLPHVGMQHGIDGDPSLELRNCPCGSTISRIPSPLLAVLIEDAGDACEALAASLRVLAAGAGDHGEALTHAARIVDVAGSLAAIARKDMAR